jgi:hypothetical protein
MMQPISLYAHFDGQQIRLDEPFELPPNAALIVTVLPPDDGAEREAWAAVSIAGLARAYGDDEPEYTVDDVK